MTVFLWILLIAAMIATLVALVRGIITFLMATEADLKGTGPSVSGMKSNRMMQARIFFQALAILVVVVILLATGRTG
ncbi:MULTISPECIES: twin transmembrane helix small protein [Sphingomonas]|uniref:twin transmembrane helix small protein n=1 Tax=Sphingomonas TaxID=13687 RepID=UPI00082D49B3|nr:twin transmembrane helix small protein [Sphingomonas sp. CCH10-B3]MBA3880092.1 twin transmembrane helix small protein [Sphingobium sp.]